MTKQSEWLTCPSDRNLLECVELVKMSVKANKKGSGIAFEEPVKEVLVPYKTGIRF